jgi:HSF-type DNA-binding
LLAVPRIYFATLKADIGEMSESTCRDNYKTNELEDAPGFSSNCIEKKDIDMESSTEDSESNRRDRVPYLDFSRDLPDPRTPLRKIGRDGVSQTFPMKLHAILSNPELCDIISWLPHGRAWRILQPKAFEDRALPLYFR